MKVKLLFAESTFLSSLVSRAETQEGTSVNLLADSGASPFGSLMDSCKAWTDT
jgi:hypothetical protein